ncbi:MULTISPECIES: zinc ribbon domain-containing protein [Spirosoma]|uniref:C4-type zinc ribbon domain-containing protein n=1 Tax=Spirosoma liriopis TaxID=2937440 RepID=A0ABT0HN75_9BACT|nr:MULTISPECIES: C4-type zinc ribbon domain-containing protein [Spirosoma]MCK8493103.1 C4-type zinc ribbon domain-containing protein [Spirosoma liriopis]UHG92502.1 C4-type zinc ribbon domain-containing protein [Spirosoma oryzicola]
MELTIAQKLDALLKLQSLDSQLDELIKIRGGLPEEVRDLEDDIAGFETRIGKFQAEIKTLEEDIERNRIAKKDAEKLITKYKDQQMNVRNNREFDAISKEIELQSLEIELAEKRINEAQFRVRGKEEEIKTTTAALNERKEDLKAKKQELDQITSESQEEEKAIIDQRDEQATTIEPRLLNSYNKIRGNALNGLAVVMVKRGACGGCFNVVPPQRQADIKDKKKIIVCEHCGRIFADVEGVPEPAPVGRGR